jgi:small-conductance mechanosensitive channel
LAVHKGAWAAGLFVGSILAWINFRWLRRGLDALVVDSAAQAGSEKPSVHTGSYTRFALRYILMGLCIYAIFEFLKIPLASMFVGLCALGAAVLAASVYEILRAER